jgi:hypothetical protein
LPWREGDEHGRSAKTDNTCTRSFNPRTSPPRPRSIVPLPALRLYTIRDYCSPHLPNPDGRIPSNHDSAAPATFPPQQPAVGAPSTVDHAQNDLLPGWHGWAETLTAEAGGYEQRSRSQHSQEPKTGELRLCACMLCNVRVITVMSQQVSLQNPICSSFSTCVSNLPDRSVVRVSEPPSRYTFRYKQYVSVLFSIRHSSEPRSKTPSAHIPVA